MSKVAKPLTIIVVALVLAGGAGLYWSRQASPPEETSASSVADLPTDGGRFRGPEHAPVTLMEFGDYQCPSCGAYAPIVDEVLRRFPTQVRLEFHHFPLVSVHQFAMAAALAAESAGDQGRFWEMHDLLFARQDTWSRLPNAETEFVSYAGQLGLDVNKFMQGMRSPEVQQRVLEDVVRANNAKIQETPTFFINGEKIARPSNLDDFSRVIQDHLPKQ